MTKCSYITKILTNTTKLKNSRLPWVPQVVPYNGLETFSKCTDKKCLKTRVLNDIARGQGFSLEKFNVTLGDFCSWPIRTMVDSMEIPILGPLGMVLDVQKNPNIITSKLPLTMGDQDPIWYIVPSPHPSPHRKRHLNRFRHLCTAYGQLIDRPAETHKPTTDQHITLLLSIAIGHI